MISQPYTQHIDHKIPKSFSRLLRLPSEENQLKLNFQNPDQNELFYFFFREKGKINQATLTKPIRQRKKVVLGSIQIFRQNKIKAACVTSSLGAAKRDIIGNFPFDQCCMRDGFFVAVGYNRYSYRIASLHLGSCPTVDE